jgi:hypothetical protein
MECCPVFSTHAKVGEFGKYISAQCYPHSYVDGLRLISRPAFSRIFLYSLIPDLVSLLLLFLCLVVLLLLLLESLFLLNIPFTSLCLLPDFSEDQTCL